MLLRRCSTINPTKRPIVQKRRTHDPHGSLPSIFLELPVAVVERADLASLEPARDAVKVKRVLDVKLAACHGWEDPSSHIANPPRHCALFACCRRLVRLAFDAWTKLAWSKRQPGPSGLTEIHDMVAADGTVVNHNVPCPQCHSIPLERVSEEQRRSSSVSKSRPS